MQKTRKTRPQVPMLADYSRVSEYFAKLRTLFDSPSPVVSVITVVKNQAKELALTVASVKAQNYPLIEHIVINGGDPLELPPDLLVISEPDSGIADAFNKGIAGAAGEIICILNAGDTYLDGAICSVVEKFKANPKRKIICTEAVFKDFKRDTYYRKSDPFKLGSYMSVIHPATFVLKQVYTEIGLFSLDFTVAMDYEFLLRAKNEQIEFAKVDQMLVSVLSGGISERNWQQGLVECRRARRMYGYNSFFNYAEDGYHLFFQFIYASLSKMKLHALIGYYRKFFSTLSYQEK